METSLHQQLKEIYADTGASTEVPLDRYRIDVVSGETLIEIQHGSLSAIRDKVRRLLENHQVLVVKPLVIRKRLVKQQQKGGKIVSRRYSPKRGSALDLFDELVYFTRVFPHKNLSIETPLVEVEEWRFPGHGKRRRWRKNDFVVEDRKLVSVERIHRFAAPSDLLTLLPSNLPGKFHTGHLAKSMKIDRWVAQRIAYCLRETGATKKVGKQGNTILYSVKKSARKSAA